MDETIQIPGYIIEKNLGSGAMATVYLAEQQALERKVALKLMASSLVADTQFRERFLKEGKIIAQLNHPNIVTIYDIGVVQSSYYMAMEYVEGTTLKDRLTEPLSKDQAVDMLCQVASALGYAHKRSFVHRDVKPANILLRDDGAAILSDFGIAKVLGGEGTQMTQQGFTIGTPKYMSPEQALGKEIDARSDIYALGVVFYEMLVGAPPFQAQDSFALALAHVNDAIPRLSEDLAAYQDVIDKAMAKKPDDRYASAEIMVEDVRQVHTAAGGTVGPIGVGTGIGSNAAVPIKDKKQRSKGLLWVSSLAGIAALAIAGATAWYVSQKEVDVCANPPTLSSAQNEQIGQLMEVAEVNYEIERFVDPPITNAAHGYQQVLEIDPCNGRARDGLNRIALHFAEQAREILGNNGDLITALNRVDAGLIALPEHVELIELKTQINQKLLDK